MSEVTCASSVRSSEEHVETKLRDSFGRTLTYLRIALTDRCTLRCQYCMLAHGVPFFKRPELLTFEEWERLIAIFTSLGIQKIRITGGEPLLHPKVTEMVTWITSLSKYFRIQEVSLTTNGVRLAQLASTLKEAGLARVNVSLDSLQPDRFSKITRGGELEQPLQGIEEALRVGLTPVKVNCVVMRGINDDELPSLCQFAQEKGIEMRFLEMMPTYFTEGGRERFISISEMIEKLEQTGVQLTPIPHQLGETAEQYLLDGTSTRIGFIGSVTRKFCATCNRLRILPNGYLKLCLHSAGGIDLRSLMRNSHNDREIAEEIVQAVKQKPWGSLFDATRYAKSETVMSQVGG